MTKKFTELGLSSRALEAIDALGYETPSPVQEQAIPAVLAGRDVIAAAKTGTGKTAAFSLPALDTLGHARRGQGPLMLVVTPTRELALQIDEVCRTISASTHHQVTCVVGGVSYEPQKTALAKGVDVLIATPGRLIDLMGQDAVRLNQVGALVLDEADRMLDMGFLPDMKRIVAACPDKRQTLLFSATIDESIEKNMSHLLTDPVFVEIAHRGETADTVDQYLIPVDQRAKGDLLIALLNERGGSRIIVFARTRHRVDNTCRRLRKAGFSVAPIHSDRSQNQRKRALDAFAEGKVDILVATDVLARGIDISDVNYVVNFDLPTQAEDYVHRIGRTGRAGESGYAVSFTTPENKNELHDIEKLIGKSIPLMEVKSFDAAASEAASAAKATREAATDDPELAQAAKEYKAKQKKRGEEGEQGRNGEGSSKKKAKQQPQKTRGTAQKEDKKNQRQSQEKGRGKHHRTPDDSRQDAARGARTSQGGAGNGGKKSQGDDKQDAKKSQNGSKQGKKTDNHPGRNVRKKDRARNRDDWKNKGYHGNKGRKA